MSVVAVKVFSDGYDISADSRITQGNTIVASVPKIVRANNMTIGWCGECEDSSLLKIFATKNKIKTPSEEFVLYFMSDFYKWRKEITQEETEANNEYLVCVRNSVFYVNYWYIRKITDFYAIGSGTFEALTALKLGFSTHEAVNVACQSNIYCGLPITDIKVRNG